MTAPTETEATADAADAVAAAAAVVASIRDDLRTAQGELERAMVAYRATGASMVAIGAVAGYSGPGVFDILRRHDVK